MIAVYLGVFVLSAATLLLEITLTRVFSVTQGYHFAFMAVSLALLGFGASGTALAVLPWLLRRDVLSLLAAASIGFGAASIGSFVLTNALPFDSYTIVWGGQQLLYLALYYLSLAVPFFFAGLALGGALTKMPARAGNIYGFSLAGSGVGCLLSLWGPPLFGPSGTIGAVSLLGLLAAAVFLWNRFRWAPAPIALAAVALVALVIGVPSVFDLRISPYKSISQALRPEGAELVWSRWNAFSLVEVVRSPGLHMAPGLSFTYTGDIPPQMAVSVDGDNLSGITDAPPNEAAFTGFLPTSVAYELVPGPVVLLVEPQGGLDLLTALHQGARRVVTTLGNPLVPEVVTRRFDEAAGGIYNDDRVEVAVGGSRGYLSATNEKFDVIQVSMADSFRPVLAGAYSISESYVYTVEAFQQYFQHLNPDGFISVTRWIQVPPSDGVRMVSVAVEALESQGVERPERHIAAIRSLQTLTLLVKRSELSQRDIEAIRDFSRRLQFDLVYHPGIEEAELNRYNVLQGTPYHDAVTEILSPDQRETFYRDYQFDISPPTDDRPFYFHIFRWGQVPEVVRNLGRTFQPFGGAGFLVLVGVLIVAVAASVLLIVVPLFFRPSTSIGPDMVTGPVAGGGLSKRWVFSYFAALGLGFLWIEIPLLQRFILYLDQPTYSFATVLFAILVWSGVGSLLSRRIGRFAPLAVLAAATLALIYAWTLPSMFGATLGLPLWARFGVAVVSLAPLGIMLGIPFPRGVTVLGKRAPQLVPWAWAVNGAVSVPSAILATLLALSFGFSGVMMLAGIAYLLALGTMYFWMRDASPETSVEIAR